MVVVDRLTAPRLDRYDDFVAECHRRWPQYLRVVSGILRGLTPNLLRTASPHPDGFVKLAIGPPGWVADGQVRLHFWLPGRTPSQQPHSHPWHLGSLALAGVYHEHQPTLLAVDSGCLRKFEVSYLPGQDVRTDVRPVGAQTYRSEPGELLATEEGTAHFLPAGPVHMSAPDGSGGITLAVTSPRFADHAYFYGDRGMLDLGSVGPDDIEAIMALARGARGSLY